MTVLFLPPPVLWLGSPNFSKRSGEPITRIIIHATQAGNSGSTIQWFQNPKSQVSSHYMLDRAGKIYQFVKDEDRAWHAVGANHDSIGIEFCALDQQMTPNQNQMGQALIKWLLQKYKLHPDCITLHCLASAPGHTACPGMLFGANKLRNFDQWLVDSFKDFLSS